MIGESQYGFAQQLNGLRVFKTLENRIGLPGPVRKVTVSIRVARIRGGKTPSELVPQRDVPAFFFMKLAQVVASDAEKKGGRSALFFVKFAGMANYG
jgi:hypothetical protein